MQLTIKHYHIQNPWKMKLKPRIKLNCNTYVHYKYVHIFLAGVEGSEEVSSSLLLNDQVVGYMALCPIILLLPNLPASTGKETRMWATLPLVGVFPRGFTARRRVPSRLYRSQACSLAARFIRHKWRAGPQALSPGHGILVTRQRYKKPPAMERCEVAHSIHIIHSAN